MAEKFKLTIVTPDREFFNEEADMVEFNTTEGEIGVYAGHAPLTVIVKPGILAITQGDTVRNAALHAGFVQILPQEITIRDRRGARQCCKAAGGGKACGARRQR